MDGELFENKPERIADYFVVVGLDPDVVPLQDEPLDVGSEVPAGNAPEGSAPGELEVAAAESYDHAITRVLNTRYRAAVLDRFPLEDHNDTVLPPQVAMFALPEGLTVKVLSARARIHTRKAMQHSDKHKYMHTRTRQLRGARNQWRLNNCTPERPECSESVFVHVCIRLCHVHACAKWRCDRTEIMQGASQST